ncbi:TetR/AcrR family transcriptional regulator [Tenacibaculum caenipelagi]|uniref:TetR family transcriptional regulator n=1 Tax=Tenacibaculum caenipelagi TaxID=1325435 RepID=A0A4R6TH73_9FLAO|nr:TetR/AcrR family transcriptional regulator [Tenacibaculum caenipelagi]TDQ25587.1 TetR family transcriptional regulator [Tenacibaculum caenipelagi]
MNDTKTKIIAAAIKAFSKDPNASMEEIAESINLSRRTLHRYFSSKSELIAEIIDYASGLCLQKTEESIQSSPDPRTQLYTMFLCDIKSGYQFRFLYNFRENYKGMEDESSEFKKMMQIFRDLLKTLNDNGLFNPQLTINWIENLYFSTINTAINLINENDSNIKDVTEMAWISYFNAITNHSENK